LFFFNRLLILVCWGNKHWWQKILL
jgi:hypothetical protein